MTWSYRVMDRGGQGYGAQPTFPAARTIDELQHNCHQYLAALDEPVCTYDTK